MPITLYPGTVKKKNANNTYSDVVPGADYNSLILSDLAQAYAVKAYSVGEYCIYNGEFYECNTDIPSPGEEWNVLHWTHKSVGEVLYSKSGVINEKADQSIIDDIEESAVASESHAIGDTFILSGVLYEATSAISIGDTIAVGTNCKVVTVGGKLDEFKNTLNSLCLKGQKTAISANGTTPNVSCTGLTANHKVCNWGLFSDNNLTTPLDPNNPPADITITEKADAYDITIANYTSAFYIQPTFILPQN